MLQASIGSALAGAAQMLFSPTTGQLGSSLVSLHSRAQSNQKAKISTAIAISALATDSLAVEMFDGPLSGSACSPPNTSRLTRRASHSAVAPAHCIARSKTRRRKQPFGNGDAGDNDEDVGGPGSNDGDNGSIGGGGGADWWSAGDGDGEGGYFRDAFSTLWLWRALCVCSVLQVVHFMVLMECKQKNTALVTVSQSFFSSRLRVQPAGV